jgi:non-ribosomal peptide synthetase component F
MGRPPAQDCVPPLCEAGPRPRLCNVVHAPPLPASRAAFLPLDPRWPPHRLQQVLGEAQPAAVLWAAAADLPGGHGPPDCAVAEGSAAAPQVALVQLGPAPPEGGCPSVESRPAGAALEMSECLPPEFEGHAGLQTSTPHLGSPAPEQQQQQQQQQPAARAGSLDAAAGAARAAGRSRPLPYCYVMYTSGSTGAPLGVCGTEQGAASRTHARSLAACRAAAAALGCIHCCLFVALPALRP